MKEEQRKALDKLAEEFAGSTFGLPPTKEELKKLGELPKVKDKGTVAIAIPKKD